MKFKATYYDYELNSMATKSCHVTTYCDGKFQFYVSDDPSVNFKFISIEQPVVSIFQSTVGIKIKVDGYQWMKETGLGKTTTIIENVK